MHQDLNLETMRCYLPVRYISASMSPFYFMSLFITPSFQFSDGDRLVCRIPTQFLQKPRKWFAAITYARPADKFSRVFAPLAAVTTTISSLISNLQPQEAALFALVCGVQ